MSDPSFDVFPLRDQEPAYYDIPASEQGIASVCSAHGIAPDFDEFLSAIEYVLEDDGLSQNDLSLGHVMDAAQIAVHEREAVPLSQIPDHVMQRMYDLGKQ